MTPMAHTGVTDGTTNRLEAAALEDTLETEGMVREQRPLALEHLLKQPQGREALVEVVHPVKFQQQLLMAALVEAESVLTAKVLQVQQVLTLVKTEGLAEEQTITVKAAQAVLTVK